MKKKFSVTRVVVALAIVGAPLGFMGITAGKMKIYINKRTPGHSDCSNLEQAVQAFYYDYNRLPDIGKQDDPIPTDKELMNILVGNDQAANPKGVRYFQGKDAKGRRLEKARGGLFHEGDDAWLRDPWGHPYYLLLDHDFDDEIADPFDTSKPLYGRRVIAWSAGKDGKVDYSNPAAKVNKDNVYSWK